jgi:hypothetical protein
MAIISGSIGSALRTTGLPLSSSFASGSSFTIQIFEGPSYLTIEAKRDGNGFYSTSAFFTNVSSSNVDRSEVFGDYKNSAYLGLGTSGSMTLTAAKDLQPNDVIVKVVTSNDVVYLSIPDDAEFQDILDALKERAEGYENNSGTISTLQLLYDCEDLVNELLVALEARSTYFENYDGVSSTLNYINKTIDNSLPNDNILIFIAGQSNARGSTANTLPSERYLNQYIPDTYMWTGSVGQEQFERLVVNKTNISYTRSHGI